MVLLGFRHETVYGSHNPLKDLFDPCIDACKAASNRPFMLVEVDGIAIDDKPFNFRRKGV